MMRKRGYGSYVAESSDGGGGSSGGKADTRCQVLLLDGTEVVLEINKKTPGQWVFDSVLRKLDLLERDYFGLLFDNEQQRTQQWLDLMRPVKKQAKAKGQCQLFFCMKVYPADPVSLQQSTRMQLYWQVKRDFIESRLRCSPTGLVKLAAFIAQTELNDLDLESQSHNYLPSLGLILPELRRLENEIVEEHNHLRGTSPHDSLLSFLKMASTLDTYGTNYFEVKYEAKIVYVLEVSPFALSLSKSNRIVQSYTWEKVFKVTYNGKKLSISVSGNQGVEGTSDLNFDVESALYCKEVFETIVSHLNHHRESGKAVKMASTKDGLPLLMESRRKAEGTGSLGSHHPTPPPLPRSRALSLPRKNTSQESGIRMLPDLPLSLDPVTSTRRSQSSSPIHVDPVYAEVKPRDHGHDQEAEQVLPPTVLQAEPIDRLEGGTNSLGSDSDKDGMHGSLLDLADVLGDDSDDDTSPEFCKPNESRPHPLDSQQLPNSKRLRHPQVEQPLPIAESSQNLKSQAPQRLLPNTEPDLTRDIPIFVTGSSVQGGDRSHHSHAHAFLREDQAPSHKEQHLTQPQHKPSRDHHAHRSPLMQHLQKPLSPHDLQAHSSPQMHHNSNRGTQDQEQKEQAKLLIRSWVKKQKIKDLENNSSHESSSLAHHERESHNTHDPVQGRNCTATAHVEHSPLSSPGTYRLHTLPPTAHKSPKSARHPQVTSQQQFVIASATSSLLQAHHPSPSNQPRPSSSTLPRPSRPAPPRPSRPAPPRPYGLTKPSSSPQTKPRFLPSIQAGPSLSPKPHLSPSDQPQLSVSSQAHPSSSRQQHPSLSPQPRRPPPSPQPRRPPPSPQSRRPPPSPQPHHSPWSSPSPELQSSLTPSHLPVSQSELAAEKTIFYGQKQTYTNGRPDWYDVPQSCLSSSASSSTYDILPPTRPALSQQELLHLHYPDYDVPPSRGNSLSEEPDSGESTTETNFDKPGLKLLTQSSPLSVAGNTISSKDDSVDIILKEIEGAILELDGTTAQWQLQEKEQGGQNRAERPVNSRISSSSFGSLEQRDVEPSSLSLLPTKDQHQKLAQKSHNRVPKPMSCDEKPSAQMQATTRNRPTDLDQERQRRLSQREITPPLQQISNAPPAVSTHSNLLQESMYDRLLAIEMAEESPDNHCPTTSDRADAAHIPTDTKFVGGPLENPDTFLPFHQQQTSREEIMTSLQEVMLADGVPSPPAHLSDLSNEIENILQGSTPPVHSSARFDPNFFVKQAAKEEKKRKQQHLSGQLPPDVARFMNWVRLSSDLSEDQAASGGDQSSPSRKSHRKQGSHHKERGTSADSSSSRSHSRTGSKTGVAEMGAATLLVAPVEEDTSITQPHIEPEISSDNLPTQDISAQPRLSELRKASTESTSSTLAVKDFPAYKAELQPTMECLEEDDREANLLEESDHAEVRILHHSSFEEPSHSNTDVSHQRWGSRNKPGQLQINSHHLSPDDSLPNSPSYYTQNPHEAKMGGEFPPHPANSIHQPLLSELENQSSSQEKQTRVVDWMQSSQPFWKNGDHSKVFQKGKMLQANATPLAANSNDTQQKVAATSRAQPKTMPTSHTQPRNMLANHAQPKATSTSSTQPKVTPVSHAQLTAMPSNHTQSKVKPSSHTQTQVKRREHLYEDPDQVLKSSLEQVASGNLPKMEAPQRKGQSVRFQDPNHVLKSMVDDKTALTKQTHRAVPQQRIQSFHLQGQPHPPSMKPHPSSMKPHPTTKPYVTIQLKPEGLNVTEQSAKMYSTDV